MRPKFTDWYPPISQPTRVGYYQRKYYPGPQGMRQDYWNGECWWRGSIVAINQYLSWRGLTEASYHAAIRRV